MFTVPEHAYTKPTNQRLFEEVCSMSLKSTLITGIMLVVIGLVFIIFPDATASFFTIMVGVGMLIAAVNSFICWNELRHVGGGGVCLAFGICACALALVCLLRPLAFASTLIWITALCVVGMGIFHLFTALGLPNVSGSARMAGVVSSILMILFGALAMLWPAMIVLFLGISILVEGIYQMLAVGIVHYQRRKVR